MDYNTRIFYVLMGIVAATGVFLGAIDWTLTLACFTFTASHILVFNLGRLIEAHNRESREPVRMVSKERSVESRRTEQRRPQSLASRITEHNKRNQGWGEAVRHRSDSILNY